MNTNIVVLPKEIVIEMQKYKQISKFIISLDLRFVSNIFCFLTVLYSDIQKASGKVLAWCSSELVLIPRYRCYQSCPTTNIYILC